MKLSVAIITYNHENFIAQAIDSVLKQDTSFDYEIVIGEDCSTDKTREIVINYQKKYPDKIKALLPEKNLGITRNFIETINACRGQYIALCEGDDYWIDSHKLQRQVDFLDANPEFSMCAHEVIVRYEDRSKGDASFKELSRDVFFIEDVIEERLFVTNSLLFRKRYILGLPEWFEKVISADRALLILIASKGKIKYFNEVMGVYRKHSGGISSYGDVRKIFLSDMYLFKKINVHFHYKYKKIVQNVILNRHRHMLDYYISINDRYQSSKFFIKCLGLAIWSKKLNAPLIANSLYNILIPGTIKSFYRYIKKVTKEKVGKFRYY
jgi:glycosyltransferase involved in cell wall biosynthesis